MDNCGQDNVFLLYFTFTSNTGYFRSEWAFITLSLMEGVDTFFGGSLDTVFSSSFRSLR